MYKNDVNQAPLNVRQNCQQTSIFPKFDKFYNTKNKSEKHSIHIPSLIRHTFCLCDHIFLIIYSKKEISLCALSCHIIIYFTHTIIQEWTYPAFHNDQPVYSFTSQAGLRGFQYQCSVSTIFFSSIPSFSCLEDGETTLLR